MKRVLTLILICGFSFLFTPTTDLLAQENNSTASAQPITDLSIVLGCGLGGAVLGLSTLSFVERPGKHLKNILIGSSIGIIVGVGIVIWGQVTKPQAVDATDEGATNAGNFGTSERYQWFVHYQEGQEKKMKNQLETPLFISKSFIF